MKKTFGIKSVFALMLVASVLTCAIVAVVLFRALGLTPDLFTDVKKYIELRTDIKEQYIGSYDPEKLSDAALSAAVTALDDKWSYYMSKEDYNSYVNHIKNQYSGIGVTIMKDTKSGGCLISGVFAGSPSDQAGILTGETILAVDGADITKLTLQDVSALIGKKQPGEMVSLTVSSKDGVNRTVQLKTTSIFTNPISYTLLDGGVGYIVIKNFETGAADQFSKAIKDLTGKGATAFVFDVRNNGGGMVSEVTKMLDELLPEGDIFVSVDKSGKETVTKSGASCIKFPMAVLVNANSYSAAEYFAAVLDEYNWAQVVGENTTGKGRSQITVMLSDGSALHISSNKYLTPKRVDLSEKGGLTPEYVVTLNDEEHTKLLYGQLQPQDDAQLQKAISVLKGT